MAGVYFAAEKKEWEKVEVRRPLEAVSSSKCGPTRAVRLGLWSVDPGSLRPTPDSALLCRIQPLRQAPLGQFRCCIQALLREGQGATFRDSYARPPYCRISQFLAASFARNRRFRDF